MKNILIIVALGLFLQGCETTGISPRTIVDEMKKDCKKLKGKKDQPSYCKGWK